MCRGALHFYQDRGDPRTSLAPVLLHGCEVVPGLGPKHPFAFRVLRSGTELAALEVRPRALWSKGGPFTRGRIRCRTARVIVSYRH